MAYRRRNQARPSKVIKERLTGDSFARAINATEAEAKVSEHESNHKEEKGDISSYGEN
jgi:hypothetical protein